MTQLNERESSGKKRKNLEQSQLQSISSSASSRNEVRHSKQHEDQNEIELSQINKQNVHLNSESSSHNLPIPEQASNNGLVHRLLDKKGKIIKWFLVIFLLMFAVWLGSRFLTDSLSKTRHPMFLSSFNPSKTSEVMSPQQSDYTSFLYYKMMLNLTQYLAKQKRDATSQEMSQFREMTFKQFYNAYKVVFAIQLAKEYNKTREQQKEIEEFEETNLDQFVNKTQYFLDVANQFACSSCYSFPIAATIEYLYKFYYNITVKLSEQQLIDCAHGESENGCQQGNITRGFQYARDVGLLRTEEYPYRSITGTSYKCDLQTINSTKQKFKISGFKMLPPGSCQSIQSQLIKGNVVATMINAGDLASYTDGTFTDCKRYGLNHAVTIVGQTEKNEWIVRNSWGKSWGNNGYFVMGHGNTCGVCSYAIVPVLKIVNGTVVPYNPKDDQTKKQEK